jgi:hypothetical protein
MAAEQQASAAPSASPRGERALLGELVKAGVETRAGFAHKHPAQALDERIARPGWSVKRMISWSTLVSPSAKPARAQVKRQQGAAGLAPWSGCCCERRPRRRMAAGPAGQDDPDPPSQASGHEATRIGEQHRRTRRPSSRRRPGNVPRG